MLNDSNVHTTSNANLVQRILEWLVLLVDRDLLELLLHKMEEYLERLNAAL